MRTKPNIAASPKSLSRLQAHLVLHICTYYHKQNWLSKNALHGAPFSFGELLREAGFQLAYWCGAYGSKGPYERLMRCTRISLAWSSEPLFSHRSIKANPAKAGGAKPLGLPPRFGSRGHDCQAAENVEPFHASSVLDSNGPGNSGPVLLPWAPEGTELLPCFHLGWPPATGEAVPPTGNIGSDGSKLSRRRVMTIRLGVEGRMGDAVRDGGQE